MFLFVVYICCFASNKLKYVMSRFYYDTLLFLLFFFTPVFDLSYSRRELACVRQREREFRNIQNENILFKNLIYSRWCDGCCCRHDFFSSYKCKYIYPNDDWAIELAKISSGGKIETKNNYASFPWVTKTSLLASLL